ncbi:uncharacterized protein LOC130727633 [Lotus japonicus]|uniref:uncharacterized protein LOC130727633 n=1 Tax=Lotus japonicus TaxID=34305 RepID=UPI0025902106|nr:uncharacterized protein LOC130727633 [Lotus japonicus]
MIYILFFIFYLVASNTNHKVECMRSELEEDMELERQLKHINKPPIKTIHTKFGYIVDCVDIGKQPAFDHPLLKNHKLQRKPSFQKTMRTTNEKNSSAKPIGFGLEKNQCPIGTVPIKRITKEDLIREKLLFKNYIWTPKSPRSHVSFLPYNSVQLSAVYFYKSHLIFQFWNNYVNH